MNIIGKSGQLIPVALSASIIYESDQEVATVGILSDLRERLFIEERLLKTEERLAWSEKQALVVELAGTAAHELNQPLTSVMGYAQLLHRQLPTEYSEIHEYAEVLVREAERMAEIVRKIGHITRYETKNYVGETRILDLDRAILPTAADSADYQAVEPPGGSRSGEESHDDGPLFRDGPAGPRSREP
jgi:signal transduction histidine kinase